MWGSLHHTAVRPNRSSFSYFCKYTFTSRRLLSCRLSLFEISSHELKILYIYMTHCLGIESMMYWFFFLATVTIDVRPRSAQRSPDRAVRPNIEIDTRLIETLVLRQAASPRLCSSPVTLLWKNTALKGKEILLIVNFRQWTQTAAWHLAKRTAAAARSTCATAQSEAGRALCP
jgi:hypothetical protein